MKELIRFIAQHLVDNPGEIQVNEVNGQHTTVYELRTAKTDIGQVIGKRGQTAHAMRTILNAVSAKEKKRMVLEILE